MSCSVCQEAHDGTIATPCPTHAPAGTFHVDPKQPDYVAPHRICLHERVRLNGGGAPMSDHGECCAHSRVQRATVHHPGGLCSDEWKCLDCGAQFVPYVPGTPTEEKDRPLGVYVAHAMTIGELVERKQAAYGDSFGKSGDVMRILYPDGIPPSKVDDALTVVRVLDKLFRVATDKTALGENPWQDIAGYSLLSVVRADRKDRAEKSATR